jgi:hypothetical protein
MPGASANSLLNRLDESKRNFGPHEAAEIKTILERLRGHRFVDAKALLRFHETLLFLRAYPHNATVLRQVESILKTFGNHVAKLQDAEADLAPLDDPESSGIAGTTVTTNFSYEIVRWLVAKYPNQVAIDWEWFEDEDRFGATMPRFIPLLEEEAMVEAHTPYRTWVRAARGRRNELVWLIERFEHWQLPAKTKAATYDSLKLHLIWRFGLRASRTKMKLPVRAIFFHKQPLLQRRDVSLNTELNSPPITVETLSHKEGERVLDMARETSAVRYRELHGFTYGDSRRVLRAHLGRGVDIFVTGVPPDHRLPLRAYHAALIFKNGLPIAYFEGLSLFERMESGFNLYYTFREGETAWIYARVLRLMRRLFGVTVFSIDPYQVGHENEEGIESGAFWFYRKLGFRPVRPELAKLAFAEEEKIASRPGYRTSARTLRRLAAGHMLFELRPPRSRPVPANSGRRGWDRFEVHNLGLSVQRRMAVDFGADATGIRDESAKAVTRALGISTRRMNEGELHALENLSLVLALIPDLAAWSPKDKQLAARVIRAKAARDEARYLRLMQQHDRLRAAIVRLGSFGVPPLGRVSYTDTTSA